MADVASRSPVVAVPEPDLTPKEMIQRAESMREMLLEQQEDAEARGYYSDAVHQKFLEAGFYRMLQPRLFGGYQFDVPTFFRAVMALSRGDPGTGWCVCLASAHALNVGALFTEEAQADIFGPDGDFRGPWRADAAGLATPVEGGYIINGKWDYCSGVPYSTNFMGTCRVESKSDGPPSLVVAVMPKGGYTMLDDWGGDKPGSLLGLRSSGSNSVVVKDSFVPSARVVSMDFRSGNGVDCIGATLHNDPMYSKRVGGFFHGELVSIQVGAARAALDDYENIIRTRTTPRPPFLPRYQHVDFQRSFGLARGMIDAAEAAVLHAAEMYMEMCHREVQEGVPFTVDDDFRLWGIIQNAGRLAWEGTELLFRTAGSSAARNGQRIQRYYRDMSIYRGHFSAQFESLASAFARVHFGLPGGPFGE